MWPTLTDPPGDDQAIWLYTNPASQDWARWDRWIKPRGRSVNALVHFTAISGGGGAGGGKSGAAASARGGGGPGGGSGLNKLVIPLLLIPDVLYIQVGAGGSGGDPDGAGGAGVRSFVSVAPAVSLVQTNLLLSSGNDLAYGGAAGTGAGGGAAGAGGAISSRAPLSGGGQFDTLVGQTGNAGGAHTGAIGGAIAIPTTGIFTMAGTGGAGVTGADFAGGIITVIAESYLSAVASVGAAAGSNNGSGGWLQWGPLWSWPGLGGGSSNAGVGGDGGNGGPGSGGGGGGGGTTGGRGGRGGDGFVLIQVTQ